MIGIIFVGDLRYCPYLRKYTDEIEKLGFEYEVLYWARESENVSYKENYYSFNYYSDLRRSRYFKALDFIKYRFWLNKRLLSKKYDKLIILSTLSGMLICDILLKNYSGKYIFDIRDYSYEHNSIFKLIESKLINSSFFTAISSEGFKMFLPASEKFKLVHNFNSNEKRKLFKKKVDLGPVNVVWIGSLRYFEHQKKIIDHLKNDDRYKMFYHGTGPEINKYILYCKENEIQNIIFTGKYDNVDKHNLLSDADILNNSYVSNNLMETKYAISNKFYDGMIYGIPQLVENNTFKHEKVRSLGIGFGIDVDDPNFADILYQQYENLSEKKFNSNIYNALENVIEEDSKYISRINLFINM